MSLTNREIAEAFSGHNFEVAIPCLADDARWDLVGAATLQGSEAIVEACRRTAGETADARFSRFEVIHADNHVIIDSLAEYLEQDGTTSSVASCDIYTFSAGVLVAIRSFNVEIP